MEEFFNPEKGIWAWLSTLVDIFGLSILWIFLCMPVITIGPATAALYYTVVKCVRRREGGTFGHYFRSFRDNLKTGLAVGAAALAGGLLIFGAHYIVRWYGTRVGGILYVLYIAQYFVLVLPAGVLPAGVLLLPPPQAARDRAIAAASAKPRIFFILLPRFLFVAVSRSRSAGTTGRSSLGATFAFNSIYWRKSIRFLSV